MHAWHYQSIKPAHKTQKGTETFHYGYNFRRVMQDAGAMSVMNAYNLVNGDKCAESHDLLNGILKDRWGFPFYVVSDWGSVWDASKALKAGCDLEMDVDISAYEEQLTNDYVNGYIDDADLDRAIRRVLRVKYLTGMIPAYPITPSCGWCDAPDHPAYNRHVDLAKGATLASRLTIRFLVVTEERAKGICQQPGWISLNS